MDCSFFWSVADEENNLTTYVSPLRKPIGVRTA